MKIKDLVGFNPEAEIIVCFADGKQFNGKLSFGWDADDVESGTDTKIIAKEVVIFLGNLNNENISA